MKPSLKFYYDNREKTLNKRKRLKRHIRGEYREEDYVDNISYVQELIDEHIKKKADPNYKPVDDKKMKRSRTSAIYYQNNKEKYKRKI